MKFEVRRRWGELVAEHGTRSIAVLYVLHRVLQHLSGGRAGVIPYLLVSQPIGNAALAAVRPDPNTVVRRIDRDDPVVGSFPRPAHVNAKRFEDGSECFVAWVHGQFAGHIWIARDVYVEDEVRCTYQILEADSAVWDYDVFIVPRLRLGRTMARLWKAVDDDLAARGVRWSFSRINRFNAASIRSHERLGALEVGRVVFVILGQLQLRWSQSRGTSAVWQAAVPWRTSRVSLRA